MIFTVIRGKCEGYGNKVLVPVVRKASNSIHWINRYPVDSIVCFADIYPLDSDLSGG